MQEKYLTDQTALLDFLKILSQEFRLFTPKIKESVPNKEDDYIYYQGVDPAGFRFNPYRVIDPVKTFFTPAVEKAAAYFNVQDSPGVPVKVALFGVKSCDLHALIFQDYVFLEGLAEDALYRQRRENTLIVSSDCADFKEVCFCLAMGVKPYPEKGFDLNLSVLNDGYIVSIGSSKGEEIINKHRHLFVSAKDSQLDGLRQKRENLCSRLNERLRSLNIPAYDSLQRLMHQGHDAETWKNFMRTCVECGGCNFICSTCHCFLLADRKDPSGELNKEKSWDACQYAAFSRVAGGANPLKTRAQRLRNRFLKKFDFFVTHMKMPACCGCGRCIEVCPGKIDIREVLKDLAL